MRIKSQSIRRISLCLRALSREQRSSFENKVGFVIFDKFPVTKGHCLIVPFRVYSIILIQWKWNQRVKWITFQAKNYLDKEYKPSGYNIGVNCGKDSGQTVEHLHIHLIPRYLNDVDDPKGGVRGVIPNKQKY